jgi:hypothetical protein
MSVNANVSVLITLLRRHLLSVNPSVLLERWMLMKIMMTTEKRIKREELFQQQGQARGLLLAGK